MVKDGGRKKVPEEGKLKITGGNGAIWTKKTAKKKISSCGLGLYSKLILHNYFLL